MKVSARKFIFLFLILLSLSERLTFSQYWQTSHYSEINGLPTSFVYDISQDQWGRIWMATLAGISCYDGVSWEHYNESKGLPAASFVKIHADRSGRVWAVPDPKQAAELPVVFFAGNRWQQIEKVKVELWNIKEITSLQLFEHKKKAAVLLGTLNSGVLWWEKGKWMRLTSNEGLLSNRVNGIVTCKGKCYVATDNGLSIIKGDRSIDNLPNQIINFPGSEIKGISVAESEENPRIWLFGGGFCGYFREGNYKTVNFATGIRFSVEKEVVRLLPDCRSGLYIGNLFELFYFNYKTRETERLSVGNGLLGVGVNTMLLDFEKNIWLSCDRGVTKISSRRFSSFNMAHGLMEDEVTAVFEYEPGKFVLGHNNGLTFYDGSQFQKLPLARGTGSQPLLCRVLDINADSKKNIWVASSYMGLAKVNRRREIKWYGKEQGLPLKITSLWVDTKDNIWMGTDEGIFCLTKDGRVQNKTGEFPGASFRKIFAEKGKLRYLATHSAGLYVLDEKNRWINYPGTADRGSKGVYSIKKDSSGRLLVGTAAGLYAVDQGALKKFKTRNFDLKRPVYFIIEDPEQRLWFGTDNGVIRWDGSREIRYSIPEGLIGQEANRAAGIIDSKGMIWIGTNRGVSIYDEVFDSYNSWNQPPKLRLLYLETDDSKFPLDQPVKLKYNTRRIDFVFRGISFIDEKAIRFKHKLAGFDKDWSNEQYHYYQVIEYTNPRPGTYRFHIKAKNSMGVWSDVVTSPEITILKPFYNKWWFYLLVILGLGLITYSLFHFVTTRRNAAILEKLVEERTSQLQLTEKQYRDLFESSLDMVFISSEDGKFLDINPAGINLLGYDSKKEIMSVDIESHIYYNPADRKIFLKRIREKGYVKDYELILKRKDEEKITVLLTASIVPGEKAEAGRIRGIVRDITEKKKLQQQLEQSQKMEAIGTLAGGVAHDFNNILGMISGYLDLTIDDLPEDSPVRQNLDQVISSTNRAKDLVKQILAFSRRDSHEYKPLKISHTIKEVLKLLRSTLPATIEIRQDIKDEAGIVMAEPTQIHQIMMNLCTNAAHAMQENGGTMDVKLQEIYLDEESAAAHNNIAPGQYLRLTVSDTGHGMEPDVIKRIFDPYFTTKNPGEGTGMGLAVTHGIVNSLGGEIIVYSVPGQGTTFHVLLPTAEGVAEVPEIETEIDMEDVPRGNNERILLVDDEPLLVIVGQRLLELLGYRVVAKTASKEALAAFRAEPDQFDLVITDLTMPHMTGIKLTEEIKKIKKDIPIILCTGFNETVTEGHIKKLGIHKLLLKPTDRIIMAAAIRDALKKEE